MKSLPSEIKEWIRFQGIKTDRLMDWDGDTFLFQNMTDGDLLILKADKGKVIHIDLPTWAVHKLYKLGV